MALDYRHQMFFFLATIFIWPTVSCLYNYGQLDPQMPKVIQNDRRFEDCPPVIYTTLSVQNKKVSLKLVLNPTVHLDIPVYVGENGSITEWNSDKEDEEPCYYHDLEYNAAFSIKHASDFSEMTGTLQTEEGTFIVTPQQYPQRRLRRALGRHHSHDHKVELLYPEGLSKEHSQHKRNKRATKETYWIQVAVVVDYVIYDRWYNASKMTTPGQKKKDALEHIKYYFAHIINDVALRYSSISSNLYALEVMLSGFFIATDPDTQGWLQQVDFMDSSDGGPKLVDSSTLVTAFGSWVNQKGNILFDFDHAMLFTGLNIYTVTGRVAETDTIGRAVVGDICDFDRASVSEDEGLFQSASIAAHELAHNLGAGHDGENGCLASDQYIMTPEIESTRNKTTIYKNEYLFSSCSIAEMWKKIKRLNLLGENCMTNEASPVDGWNEYLKEQPGQAYDVTQQCVNIYGAGSYFCGRQDHANEVCRNLLCYNPAKDGCYHTYLEAMPGTSCGDKKWCYQGECIKHDDAPSMNPMCVFGDYPGRFNVGESSTSTCEEMFTGKPYLCYNENNRNLCCGMCYSMLTNITGCDYGDKSTSCAGKDISICYNHADTCCELCKDVSSTIEGCIFGDKAPWCPDLKPHQCYLNYGTCCETCGKMKIDTKIKDCEYGDKADFCQDLSPSGCYRNDNTCCSKCSALKQSDPECLYGDRSTKCAGISRGNCYANSRLCCGSCAKYETGNPKCKYGDKDSSCRPQHCSNPANHDICCGTCRGVTEK